MSPPRVRQLNWRRYLLALVLGLLGPTLVFAPAYAQDAGGAGDAPEDPPIEEPLPDAGVEGSGEAGFELGGLPPLDGQEDPEAGVEPEPVELEIIDDADRSVQIVEIDSSGFPWVDVVVAVPPALAGELQSGSFSLTENANVRSVDVVKLRDTLEVVVVIDTSGSMLGDPMAAATAAAKDFVASLDPDIRVGVVGFGATASTEAQLGSSRGEIATAIDGLSANGETALYDALVLGASQFVDENARRFVVVLSDGTDTASAATLETAADSMLDAAVNMYAITLQSADADFSGLESLAERINGQVVAATDAASLAETYASIASRLTNQYRMTYRSSATGAAKLGIAVDANGVLAVATETVDLQSGSGTPGNTNEPPPARSSHR